MNRIHFDKERINPNLWKCPYKYTFNSIYGLDHESSQESVGSNYVERDVRGIVLRDLVKDFTIELRKKLYGDSVEQMILTDLEDLIKPEKLK